MPGVADLIADVPGIAGRIHSAARLSELMARNQLAQVAPAAFVLPLGLSGGQVQAATGLFIQDIGRLIGVLIVIRAAGDATGAKGLEQLEPIVDAVIAAVVGKASDNGLGVYQLAKGELAGLNNGTLTYQLDFAIEDQLRIDP